LTILHAGSLKKAIAAVNTEFVRLNPGVNISVKSGGSAGLVRETVDGKISGILALADHKLITQLLYPELAEWYVMFASNQMVLCHTDRSRYHDQINATNWYEILQRHDCTFGRSDPDQDPAGYRTLMVWQLAELYYRVPGLLTTLTNAKGNTIVRRADDLVSLLTSGSIDYAFEYDSVSRQEHLGYVVLPDEINLSSEKHRDCYGQASVNISANNERQTVTMVGEPIVYAVTVPKNLPNTALALSWVGLLLSDPGVALLDRAGQSSIHPALASDLSKVPAELRDLVVGKTL
jgi:molybdate/tungstate transport system substrate-binding protein